MVILVRRNTSYFSKRTDANYLVGVGPYLCNELGRLMHDTKQPCNLIKGKVNLPPTLLLRKTMLRFPPLSPVLMSRHHFH